MAGLASVVVLFFIAFIAVIQKLIARPCRHQWTRQKPTFITLRRQALDPHYGPWECRCGAVCALGDGQEKS